MSRLARRLAVLTAAAAAAVAAFWVAGALAQSPIHLTVTTTPAGANDVVDFAGQTYSSAKAAITARETAGSATVPVTLTGLHNLVSNNALLSTDDASFGVALQGATTVLGQPAKLLVTASWPDATATTPDVAVLVRFDSVTLHDLNPSWDAVKLPVTFGPALVGVTDTDHSVVPNAALNTDGFLADGLAATDDTFTLSHVGVNMEAVVSSGPLTDAAGELGTTANGIRLRGTLAASLGVLDGSGPGAGLKLAVDIPVATPASFPSWLSLSSPWTLGLEADTTGNFAASFTGGLSVKPDGNTTINVTGSATVTSAAGELALTADVGALNDLFGQTWLDLHQTTLTATISKTALTGGFKAGITLGPISTDIALALDVSNAGLKASLDLTANGPVSSADLLNALGASTAGVDPGLVNITINTIAVHVSVDAPTGGTKVVTASAFGDAALSINTGSFNARMLFRVVYDGGAPDLLVGASLKSPTLKQLDPTIAFDWQLPDLAIVVSTADRTIPYADLDQPTQLFFAPELCDAQGTCADLDVVKGLKIQALVSLPADLISQLGDLGITVNGPLDISGTLPILGGSQVSLKVALPTIAGGPSSLVKEGTVSFDIAFDTTTKTVKASINGNMVFRITRSGACDGTEAGTWPGTTNCYDELNLTVAAGLSLSPTDGIEITLSAQIDEWNHAFGVDWLKINTFRLQLGIKAGGTSPVSLEIGILGRMMIGTAPQTIDLTLAIKVAITPTPPWIDVTGFTVASGDGIALRQVAQLFDPRFDTTTLPDLSLKNLWFAYGTETDEALCIRQGLFISAELHLGAPTSANSTPGCIPGQSLPASADQLPTAGCESANTCVAAILLDVQTGSNPSITAAGFIRQFDLGPLHFDSTKISLELSAAKQRLFFSGGATLFDPTGATTGVWASGALTVDLSNNAGAVSLFVDGQLNIGGGDGLTARATGTVAVDFSQLGKLNIEAFLATAQFDFKFEFSSPALDKFGNQVSSDLAGVRSYVENVGVQVQNAFDPNANPNLKGLVDLFSPTGQADPNYTRLLGVDTSFSSSALLISQLLINLDAQIRSVPLLGPPIADFVQGNAVRSINAAGGIPEIALHGGEIVFYDGFSIDFGLLGTLVIIPKQSFVWPGDCTLGKVTGPVCDTTVTPATVTSTVIEPVVRSQYQAQTGFTLPGTAGAAKIAALAPAAAAAAPSGDAIADVRKLNDAFTTDGVTVECATMNVHYGPSGNRQDPAIVTVDAYGTETTVTKDLALDAASQPSAGTAITGATLDNILGVTAAAPRCAAPTTPVGAGGTSLATSPTTINEGAQAALSGTAEAAFFGKTITITWGDGTTGSVIANATNGTWSLTHVYADDAGAGGTTNYAVSAQANGATTPNSTRVTVNNVAPTLAGLTLSSTVVEGGSATLSGTFTDPGALDNHVLLVTWGDGTQTTKSFTATEPRSFSLSHLYRDDNPTRTASDTVAVHVVLSDKDGGKNIADPSIVVNNVAPSGLVLTSAAINGVTAARDSGGRLVVPEGATVTWAGSFRDVGLDDANALSVDWGDGTPAVVVTTQRDVADPALIRFTATHVYADDNPTATASDLFTVTMTATDDDTGVTTTTDKVRVNDVAPVVSVAAVPATNENLGITMSASFTDVGLVDTHTAVVDWGDGTAPQTVAVVQAAGSGTLVTGHVYGDNGTFTITVKVTDDDTVVGVGTTAVRVDNVNPNVTIDRGTTMSFGGVATLVGVQNSPTAFKGSVTDPGSDDITVTWAFGDGLSNVTTNLVNPPATDPALSASVQPRSFTVANNHTYTSPCLYRAALSARDDDGGIATPDGIDVVILASAHRWESLGFWKNQYRGKASISAADLACYLKMVSHMSTVFGTGDPVPLATSAQATAVLSKEPETELSQLDRELLLAWLNIANGALPLTTLVVGDDGQPTQTVAAILVGAENVRRDPTSTKHQLEAARDAVKRLHKD